MEELNRQLDDLKNLVAKELEKINKKGDLTPVELKNAMDAMCLLEKIEKVQNESEIEEAEYSERGRYNNGSYSSMRMPRYSHSYGYSRHSIHDRIVDKLESMMDEAHTEYERGVISEWIAKIENNR